MQMNTNPLEDLSSQDLERMYPDLYQKIKPYIEDIANKLRNQKIDENTIESIVQDILRLSGLSVSPSVPNTNIPNKNGGTCISGSCPADIMYDANEDVMAVQRPMNFGNMYGGYPHRQYLNPYNMPRRRYPQYPIYPNYPPYYNYSMYPQDLVRIMLLRQLSGYNPY